MTDFQTLDNLNVNGKRVLLRGDLNVPMKNGRVADATRLERLIPTIHEMRMPGMAKAFTHGKYTSHISFAKMVESHVSRDSNRCSRQGRT